MSVPQPIVAAQPSMAEFATRIAPCETYPRAKRWTRQQYDEAVKAGIFDGQRVQLIDGEILEMSPQGPEHVTAVILTHAKLITLFGPEFTVRSQAPLAASNDSEPEPDISVVMGGPRSHRVHPTRALLVVEVSDSSLAIDRQRKALIYAQAGIEDYWVLNLQKRQLEVHRQPTAEGYKLIEVVPAEGRISPLAAPESAIEVGELLP